MSEGKNIEMEGQIKDYMQYIAELEEIVHHNKELKTIVGHEMRNKLNIIQNYSYILIKKIEHIPDNRILRLEEKKDLINTCKIIQKNIKPFESLATMLHLSSLRHKELKSNSEQFDLEEIVRENIYSLEEDLEKNHLGVEYSYDRPNKEPIRTYAHKGFMNAIINTILFNLIKHAPEYSLSRIGLSVQSETLELISENLIGKSRSNYGQNTGVGFYLLDLAKKQLRGELHLDTKVIDRTYSFSEVIGHKNAKRLEDHDIFSLRFYIPMKELTFHQPRKQ